jgi:hypothetical protein
MGDILSAVDFDTVMLWLIEVGIVIIGIAMGFKAIGIAKRMVLSVGEGDSWNSHNGYTPYGEHEDYEEARKYYRSNDY